MMNKKLRQSRIKKKISVTEMSHKLGFKYPSGYAKLEAGDSRMTIDYAKKICNILDEDPMKLFFEEELLEKSS